MIPFPSRLRIILLISPLVACSCDEGQATLARAHHGPGGLCVGLHGAVLGEACGEGVGRRARPLQLKRVFAEERRIDSCRWSLRGMITAAVCRGSYVLRLAQRSVQERAFTFLTGVHVHVRAFHIVPTPRFCFMINMLYLMYLFGVFASSVQCPIRQPVYVNFPEPMPTSK